MKKYEGMFKKYFILNSNQNAASEEAQKLLNSVSTIDLGFSIGEHPAFIVYCDELIQELTAIRQINTDINQVSRNLPVMAMQQFIKQALIEEIHQTNQIENVNSTRKEIKDALLVIENGKKGSRFDSMIRKYQMLLSLQQIPLSSCQDVRDLYDSFIADEVLKEDPNDAPDGLYFRKGSVSVVKNGQEIHQGVNPESKLNCAMEQALLFLNNDDYDPLIRIAGFHYLFGYIHPFYNGNGRMTRFISSYELCHAGIHLLAALRLSYIIKNSRTQYYKLFKTTNDRRNFGDVTLFVTGFLKFIEDACSEVAEFLNEKNALLTHYFDIIEQYTDDPDIRELLRLLVQVSVCEGDSLSISELMQACGKSKYIIVKQLDSIANLCKVQSGRPKLYRADLEKLDEMQ